MPRTDNGRHRGVPDFVWDTINDIEACPPLVTEYADASIVLREGNTVRFRLTRHPDQEYDRAVWTLGVRADRGPAT